MSTQQIFGTLMPIVYINGVPYQLPQATRGGRKETFEKESVTWTDIDRVFHERVKGYRLKARYEFEYLTNDGFEDLLTIFNAAKSTNSVNLKFETIPIWYPVNVGPDIDHGLADGYITRDTAVIEFTGRNLVKEFPNPDNIYTLLPTNASRMIVI